MRGWIHICVKNDFCVKVYSRFPQNYRNGRCCVFWPANAFKNKKKYLFHHAHEMQDAWRKSLLVSEWLPKAGWHLKAGCSFGILLTFFPHFSSWALHEPIVCMMKKVFFRRSKYGNFMLKKLSLIFEEKYRVREGVIEKLVLLEIRCIVQHL